MDLVLIRHPAVNVTAGICYGRTDVQLATDPVAATERIASRLETLIGDACSPAIETSPRARCRLVAEALAAKYGVALYEDARLAEMDFGAWDGCAWASIGQAPLDAWAANFLHAREHGGESVAMFQDRVRAWLDDRRSSDRALASSRVVVTHAGVLRAVASLVLGVSLEHTLQWPIDCEGIAWLKRARAEHPWTLVRWNV